MLITYPRSSIPLVAFSATQGIISALFSRGQQGAVYVSKPTVDGVQVLFQDAAGTTPVVDDGDPVGRMLDLSPKGNHATQSTAASKPLYRTNGTQHWLKFDGVDDFLVAPAVDFSTFDSILASAALASVAASAPNVVLAVNSPAVDRGFALQVFLTDSQLVFRSRGSLLATASQPNFDMSPHVVSGLGEISTDTCVLRKDGLQVGSSSEDQGTGTYPNADINIGFLPGTSVFLEGDLHGVVIAAGAISDSNRDRVEEYLGGLNGVAI